MKGNWIIPMLALYFIGIVLYIFQDASEFWTSYYWCLNSYLICSALACNFKQYKTIYELSFILFTVVFRLLMLAYFLLTLCVGKQHQLINILVFFGLMGISGMLSLYFYFIKKSDSWKTIRK